MDCVNIKDQLLTFLVQRYHAAPGGSFCYAPGVPFFGNYLKELPRYQVIKTRIAANSVLAIGEIAYATRITTRFALPNDRGDLY
jgi:hypothetical protein